jgi:flagellar assembly protein FliH
MFKVKSKIIKKPGSAALEDELILKFKPLVSTSILNEKFKQGENEKEKEDNVLSGGETVFFDLNNDFFKDDESKEKFINFVYTKKNEFLNGIKEEAKQIKTRARAEGQEIGYSEGLSKGKAEILDIFSESLEILDRVPSEINSIVDEIYKSLEKDILKMAIAIAEKIIRQKIAADDDIVLNSLKLILKTIPQVNNLIIYLNPLEYEKIKNSIDGFSTIMERYKEVKFVDDARVEKGGVVVETELGNVDGMPGSQLEKLEKAFESVNN